MSSTHRFLALCLGASLLAGIAPLPAQEIPRRDGFWGGFGVGYGSAGVHCTGCPNGAREGSGAGFIRMGGTLLPNLLLGAEYDIWIKDANLVGYDARTTISNVSACLYWYPRARGRFFAKGGIGFFTLGLSASTSSGLPANSRTSGFGLVTGIGYDIPIGYGTSVTPVADLRFGHRGHWTSTGRSNVKVNVVSLGVSLTFH